MGKRLTLLLIAIALICLKSFAITDYMLTANDGNVIPESPRAARFLEVTAPRAALVTGATQFDIPLYTLSVQELNLSFSLKYLSNGIKVFDDPCPVSYGWSLMPALRVTRRINGRPDELFPFLGDIPYNSDGPLPDYVTLYRCVADSGVYTLSNYTSVGRYDPEKDIFTIHLPDRNVTCIADFKNGTPRFITVNADDIRIEGDAKLTYIKVTDTKGTVYEFGKRGEYCENTLNCNEWLLTKSTLLSGDKVNFEWTENNHVGKNHRELAPNTISNTLNTMKPGNGRGTTELIIGADSENPLVQQGDFHRQLELVKVTFPGGTINLDYTRSEKGPHLTDFTVRNNDNDIIKRATLSYSDLMLKSVDISGVGRYDFGYYEYGGMTRYSQDLWGFYNGDKEAFTLVPEMEVRHATDYPFMSSTGASRHTDEKYMCHRLLNKVVYPTGGYTRWDHEAHRFAPRPDSVWKQMTFGHYIEEDVKFESGGGLRVKSITTATDSTDISPIVTNYIYGTDGDGYANCSAFPFLYTFVSGVRHLHAIWNDFDESTGYPITSVVPELLDTYNLTINTTSNYLKHRYGTPIWYSQVTELTGEGKTEHYFKELVSDNISSNWLNPTPQGLFSMASKGPVEVKTIMYKGSGSNYSKISTTDLSYKIVTAQQSNCNSGWAISREITQSQHANLLIVPDFGETGMVKLIDHELPPSDRIVIHNYLEVRVGDWGPAYSVRFYTLDLKQERLVSQTSTQHFDNGDVTSSVSFEYLDQSETPSKVTATLPDGSTRVVDLHYPVKGNSNWERMIDLNLGHTPVRSTLTENISGKTSVKTVANNYSLFGSKSIPRVNRTSAWRGNSAPVVLGEYTYDNRGNMLSRLTRDSVLTTWEWDSNGLYPVSQTVGDRFVTAFEWKDLVGMTSQTSPIGTKTKYAYDSAGRLVTESLDGYGTLNTYRYYPDRGASRIEADRWLDAAGKSRVTAKSLFDGLGRQWLAIAGKAGGPTADVATLTEYDAMSRPYRQWSPAPIEAGAIPAGAADVVSAALIHYEDNYPYTLIEYEPDERRMVKAQTPPGAAWHIAGKSAKTRTLTNVTTKDSPYSCPLFDMESDGSIKYLGLAPAGTLTVTEVTDEDGNRSLTFTDGRGRTVMTRTGPDGDFADTRFVYNGFDDLLCVLPPMLGNRDYTVSSWEIKNYGYLYTYDERGQCTSKKLPGRDELRMRYDPAGRLVATQDGNQRAQSSWTVYMFDRYGREALTADVGASDSEMDLFASGLNHVDYTGDPEFAGYTPAIGLPFMMTVATAEYYDDYRFTSLCKSLCPDAATSATVLTSPTGLRTGGYSGGERFETVYYDSFGRPVFSAADTGVGVAVTKTEYTYSGQVRRTVSSAYGTEVITRHGYDSAGRPNGASSDLKGLMPTAAMPLSISGPVIDIPVKPIDGGGDMSVTLTYGKTGTLECARFGNKVSQSVARDCGGREISRTVSLPFAVRAPNIGTMSLPGIETGGEIGLMTRDITEVLKYADAAVPAFNGNVGERVFDDAAWIYHYDAHNRLTKADYRPTDGGKENFSTTYTYDRQANITRMKKYGLVEPLTGEYGVIDDLFLAYEGNQAVLVEDYGEDPVFDGAGGYNAPEGVGEMAYDANGNLISDSGRGITKIVYNRLNLPTTIYFGDGHRQSLSYDGRGNKLSVTYSTATTPVLANGTAKRYKTDYVRRYGAGRVVRGDSVEMIMHPYGYFDGNGEVRYYLHDFQGNVTMVVDGDGEVLQHSRYYPYGEAIDVFAASAVSPWAPAADRSQPYLFSGKELERMHGLGEYDFGARRLPSHLPLWTTQDPCLEKYYPISPYAYCAGNPIRFTDPSGCAHYINNLNGEYLGTDGNVDTNEIYRLIGQKEYSEILDLQPENLSEVLEAVSTQIQIDEDKIIDMVNDIVNESIDDKLEHQIFLVLSTGDAEIYPVDGGCGTPDKVKMETSEIGSLNIRLLGDDNSIRPPFNIIIGQVHTHLDLTKNKKSLPAEGVSSLDQETAQNSGFTIYAVDTFAERSNAGNKIHRARANGTYNNHIGSISSDKSTHFPFGIDALKNYKR